jgi:hypothetical protein
MGYGEVVGNESVHWVVAHEDEAGTPVGLSSRRKRGHAKVGNNVHVDDCACGCDPIHLGDVGRRKGHKGRYRVRLRYAKKKDAEAAAAKVKVKTEGDMYVLVLDVPVIHRADPDEGPPAEIRIDW